VTVSSKFCAVAVTVAMQALLMMLFVRRSPGIAYGGAAIFHAKRRARPRGGESGGMAR
jgi:hypothetical protein